MPAASPDTAPGFLPLAVQPGWVLEQYFGWRCAHQQPGLKLLWKRHGPLRSHLLVSTQRPREELADLVERGRLTGPLELLWVCDLTAGSPPSAFEWKGRRLPPLRRGRWFGVGTFVIDLAVAEDRLFSAISARERTKLRQAERNGLQAEALARPSPAELAQFVRLYAEMARERGLERPTLETLLAMTRDEAVILAQCRNKRGDLQAAALAFTAHEQGYFLYGVRSQAAPSGAGMLAQWAVVRALKAAGLRYYDLGLVASTSEDDGRYRFKRALGGVFVPFGQEYRFVPAWLQVPHRAFQWARLRLARGSGRSADGS